MLINISNDGYLGPTPVSDSIANGSFAPWKMVAPSARTIGDTAYISERGEVRARQHAFRRRRALTVRRASEGKNF